MRPIDIFKKHGLVVLVILASFFGLCDHAKAASIAHVLAMPHPVIAPHPVASPPAQAARYRADLVRVAHAEWGLSAPIAAFAAQVHQESGWRPDAVSKVGATGMAQFMPDTAQWWCDKTGTSKLDCQPTNPRWALRALAGYDRWLYQRVSGNNEYDKLWAALRGYNGGLGHWQQEAKVAASVKRDAVDIACGTARRSKTFCPENLGYPRRILITLQPLYARWGGVVQP